MLRPVNPTDLAFASGAVLALLAISWWLRARSRSARDPGGEAKRRFSAERFDTTMGELRDMREALRPMQRPPTQPPQRAPGPMKGRAPAGSPPPDQSRH
jgi:hypothetical protein